jgi:hypothetical protein
MQLWDELTCIDSVYGAVAGIFEHGLRERQEVCMLKNACR